MSNEMNASNSGANSGDSEANALLAATCCLRSMSHAPAACCISEHASFRLCNISNKSSISETMAHSFSLVRDSVNLESD